MSLKQKTVTGLFWSFVDNIAVLLITFIVGILLARLLSPKEYGLIGMLSIFLAISQSFIDSGFSQALIRKQDCTETDYSTVFYFNIIVAVFSYLVLFFSADLVANFFHESILKNIIRILALGLLINSTSLIHSTKLTKQINFKLQAKISVISSVFAGVISIYLAYKGFGVWSLVAAIIFRYTISSILLWCWVRWFPSIRFSLKSFRELFSFGGKLLLSGLIDTIYKNIYNLVIGKYYSASDLGFYSRADQFQALPSSNLQTVVGRVSYPTLVTLIDDKNKLKKAYQSIIKSTMLLSFVMMLGMAAIARPMILTLLGDKWSSCIVYLQWLCFVGMFYPLHALNLNMLQVQGRSDLFLKLEIIKKIFAIPIIIAGIFWGIKSMILGMFLVSFISLYLNSFYSGRQIGYSFLDQLKDILPAFLIALFMSSIVYSESLLFNLTPFIVLIIQLFTGILLTFAFCEIVQLDNYLFIKKIVKERLFSKN